MQTTVAVERCAICRDQIELPRLCTKSGQTDRLRERTQPPPRDNLVLEVNPFEACRHGVSGTRASRRPGQHVVRGQKPDNCGHSRRRSVGTVPVRSVEISSSGSGFVVVAVIVIGGRRRLELAVPATNSRSMSAAAQRAIRVRRGDGR